MNAPAPGWLLLAVAGGGAVGALLRHGANQLALLRGPGSLPLATFGVNVVGCFLAGLLLVWIEGRGEIAPFWRALLVTGLLGGLTTFSAFGLESWAWLRSGRLDLLLLATAAHVVAGIAAVAAGWRLGRALWGG